MMCIRGAGVSGGFSRSRGGRSGNSPLPVRGLVDGAYCVSKDYWQLACGEVGRADALVERCRASKNLAVHLLRVDDADGLGKVVANHLHRGFQVGIARNENGAVVFVPECVKKHVRGNVHVRAFFLRLDDADEWLCGVRVCDAHHDRMGKVAAKDAIRSERTEGAKVDFLTERLAGIVWARENSCREVLHSDDLVFRRKNLPRHCEDVQPSVRRSLQCAVVEVEAVNIHNRSNLFLSKSESRPVRGGPAPVRRSYSGVK